MLLKGCRVEKPLKIKNNKNIYLTFTYLQFEMICRHINSNKERTNTKTMKNLVL